MQIKSPLALLLVIVIATCSALAQTEAEKSPRVSSCGAKSAKILILGTYHMNNPGLDDKNTQADDVLSARRQREIAELVERIARYRPTKIAIEAPYRSTAWPDRYKKYLTGEYRLGRDEIEQIGFQLANRLNLTTLYPIDFNLTMNGLTPSEIEYPKPKLDQTNEKKSGDAKKPDSPPLSEEDLLLRRSTVVEYLRSLNSEQRIQDGHAQYLEMLLPNDSPAIYGRTDLVTNWYKRNLRMFTNINRITDFPNDRILLIVGSGHQKLLRDFASGSPQFCLEDTMIYLK